MFQGFPLTHGIGHMAYTSQDRKFNPPDHNQERPGLARMVTFFYRTYVKSALTPDQFKHQRYLTVSLAIILVVILRLLMGR